MAKAAISWILLAILSAAACTIQRGEAERPAAQPAAATRDRGEDIVAEHLKRDTAQYRHDRVRFTVKDEEGTVVNEIEVWRKQDGATTSTLSIITKPADDAGTGSLAVEQANKPTVITTYSRSREEFRETDSGKMFFGGITAQELLGEWDKYDYKLAGEHDINGRKTFEVDGKLKKDERSAIATTKIAFDAETYLPIEMHLFDATGKELRTYTDSQIKTSGSYSYVAKVEVDNHIYNSHTTVEILSREYPDKLDGSLFTKEKLKGGK